MIKIGSRRQLAHRLREIPNVSGFGVGLKMIDGHLTRKKCISIAVEQKIPDGSLHPAERIPEAISIEGRRWPTDAVFFGKLRFEKGPLPIRSEDQQGTIGCYAQKDGLSYGVSCAHVIGGVNGIVDQNESVETWDGLNWLPLGPAAWGIESKGTKTSGDWGLLDAGFVSTSALPANAAAVEPFNDLASESAVRLLLGRRVVGHSHLSGTLRATISHVFMNIGSDAVDLVISSDDGEGLTYIGDSGLLWTLADGTPLAIHVGGYRFDDDGRSTSVAGFFVGRIARLFKLQLHC